MAYYNKLSFANGYYSLGNDGVVTLKENMPPEMRKRFWKVWPSVWEELMNRAKTGEFKSDYPIIFYMEEDPNKAQYENLK